MINKSIAACFLLITVISKVNGINAPQFTTQPVDFTGLSAIWRSHKNLVHWSCAASGTVSYAWKHNSVKITPNSRVKLSGGNLTIDDILGADVGKYMCLATNSYGTSVSREATLEVRYSPGFSNGFVNHYRKTNENIRIQCKIPAVTSPRPVSIFWTTPDNKKVLETARIAVTMYDGDLVFMAGTVNDTNTYSCNTLFQLVDANSGSSSESTNKGSTQMLNVTADTVSTIDPKIIVPPNDTAAEVDQNRVVLECIAVGFPVPSVKWQKVVGTLPTGRFAFETFGRHLVIKNVSLSDAGDYKCTAIAGGKQVSATAKLSVYTRPKWSTSISDTEQPVESDFIWPCSTRNTDIKYRWFVNGDEINATFTMFVLHTNGSLTIKYLNVTNSKVYSCMAYNKYANIVKSGYLKVVVAAPAFTAKPYAQTTLFRGEDSTLRCTVTGGPRPKMTYTKNGAFVDTLNYEKYTKKLNGDLIIKKVIDSDAGTYECMASNRLGDAKASGIAVVVNATKFTKVLTASTVRRYKSFSLSCTVTKASTLTVVLYWQRDGINVTTSRATITVSGLTTTLKYSNSTLADTGKFACVAATNIPHVGYVTKTTEAKITVNDVPNPPFNFTYQDLTANSVFFSWLAGSDNNSPLSRFTIKYQVNTVASWRIAEDYIPVASTLSKITISPFNSYRFAIVAVNSVGVSADSAHLIFVSAGDVPYNAPGEFRGYGLPKLPTAINVSFIALSREEVHDVGMKYILYYRPKGGSFKQTDILANEGATTQYQLTGLLQKTVYDLQLQPRNNKGFGKSRTAIISISTGIAPPTAAPTNIKAYLINNTKVKLTWKKITTSQAGGTTEVGYRVSFWMYDHSIAKTLQFGNIDSITVDSLSQYFTYNFRVNAYNNGGDGPFSVTVTKYTKNPVPDAVTKIGAYEPKRGQVVVNWTAPVIPSSVKKIQQYKINYTRLDIQGNPTSYVSNMTASVETVFTFYRMITGTYRFTVTAKNTNGYGIPATIQFQVAGLGPSAPTGLSTSNIQETAVDLKWTATENPASGFFVQFKLLLTPDSHKNISNLIAANIRTHTVTGLKAATSYSFQVVALANNIFSLPSNQVNVTTKSSTGAQRPFYQEAWFIGLVSGVGGLIVLMIIICLIRSNKDKGKKSPSYENDKKKPQVPPPPMDTPEEDLLRPQLPEEDHYTENSIKNVDVEEDSLDSMDQYADLPQLSKFTEDGSFIGEYGDAKYVSNLDRSSYLGDYSDPKYEPAGSIQGGSYAPTLRSSRPGSPPSTINPNNSAFSTFV